MKLFEFILFIMYSFLSSDSLKKVNQKGIEIRSINALLIILTVYVVIAYLWLYAAGVYFALYSFNKWHFLLLGLLIVWVRFTTIKKYKKYFYEIIDTCKKKYSYTFRAIKIIFSITWLITFSVAILSAFLINRIKNG